MGKNLRSSVVVNNKNGTSMAGPVTERLTLLERRYSKVLVHQTYFKIMDEWLQCMFGAQLFPKLKDMHKEEEAEEEPVEDFNNPFYELHILYQRVAALEEKLESLGFPVSSSGNKIKALKAPPPKPALKRTYGAPPIRRRSNYARSPEIQVRIPAVATKRLPPVLKPVSLAAIAALSNKQTIKPAEDSSAATTAAVNNKLEDDKISCNKVVEGKPVTDGEITSKVDEENKRHDEDLDKPPVLEQQALEQIADTETKGESSELVMASNESSLLPITLDNADYVMDVDEFDAEEDEEIDEKPILPSPDELALDEAGYSQSKQRGAGSRSKKATFIVEAEMDLVEEDQPVVTYTARGRRHTVPRRYAEYTGHDNVASILKSQQRAAATQAAKAKKATQGQDKPKTPTKPKPSSAPKLISPKKPPADGSRPECVYQLIASVQSKEVDKSGDVVLWDAYPDVKVNQQQLISVIFRSNGMSTRLTRKMTTLVFEDQVLASTSPFGTKYYQERLPPEPLEAMVEFIAASGFDPEYTKKKIYMIVGQVCNEARAGRVRKLLPATGSQLGDDQMSS